MPLQRDNRLRFKWEDKVTKLDKYIFCADFDNNCMQAGLWLSRAINLKLQREDVFIRDIGWEL